MERRVIINSIHSDSIFLIGKQTPDIVISLDGHPDLGHWDHTDVVDSVIKLNIPQKIKSALFRTSIQALLRVCLPWSEIISVVPEACVITDFNWRFFLRAFSFGNKSKRKKFTKQVAISDWQKRLNKISIKSYLSPPNKLESLSRYIKSSNVVLDIDVDYIYELTEKCYTPAGFSDLPVPVYGMPKDNLGSMGQVLDLVGKVKPKIITLSEIKSETLNSDDPQLKYFLALLERMGYKIERGVIYADEKVQKLFEMKAKYDRFIMDGGYQELSFISYLDYLKSIGLLR